VDRRRDGRKAANSLLQFGAAGFVPIKKKFGGCHSERRARRSRGFSPAASGVGILHPLKRVQNDKGNCLVADKNELHLYRILRYI
jgi:hypothetical protein